MLDRWIRHVEATFWIPHGATLLLAVSGGRDSMALLDLAAKTSKKQNWNLIVAHLDHGLRSESVGDLSFVRDESDKRGLEFRSGRVDVAEAAKEWGLSIEAAARRARFTWLAEQAHSTNAWGVMLGHHRDDQVETLLLRLVRGTGPSGLRGIRSMETMGGVRWLRPLLPFGRNELSTYCVDQGLNWREDHTNADPVYDRNRIRMEVLPLLKKLHPGADIAIARLAELTATDEEWLDELVERELGAGSSVSDSLSKSSEFRYDMKRMAASPLGLQRRLVRALYERALSAAGRTAEDWGEPPFLDASAVDRVLQLLERDGPGGRMELPGGIVATREYDEICFRVGDPEPTDPFYEILPVPGSIHVKESGIRFYADTKELPFIPGRKQEQHCFCWDGHEEVIIRQRMPGDRLGAPSDNGSSRIKRIFMQARIPQHERDRVPIITIGGEPAWAVGVAVNRARVATNEETGRLYIQAVWL